MSSSIQQVTQTSLKIGEEEVKCQKMADLAMADLAEAMPALEEARKALEALNKKVCCCNFSYLLYHTKLLTLMPYNIQ